MVSSGLLTGRIAAAVTGSGSGAGPPACVAGTLLPLAGDFGA
jgi:hypothetical protein